MKTLVTVGTIITLFMYLVFSMFNKTWDLMKYSQESTYWFGCLITLGWFGCWMWYVLEGKDSNKNYF